MQDIKGIIVPILTPMYEDESINEQELRFQIERLIRAGVHGIFPIGTNGEGYILSEDEKVRVLEICAEQVNHRIPVYAGTGCISTRDTVRLSQKAEAIGVDVLSVITPSFAAASQNELYDHFRAVAESVKIPMLLYNIPARTGNAIAPDTAARLSKIGNVAGIKDSSGNFDNILQCIERTRENDFRVLSGNDSLILWTLIAGGTGAISGCANVFPENMVAIYENFISGDIASARQAQDVIRPFRNCFKLGNPNTITKAATAMLGYPVGACRAPFHQLSPEAEQAIRLALDDLKAKGVIRP